ncbi:MAG: hypothetical protein FJ271_27795 [Planctomycetes bacterium]|nr:hypothetical protein [Planctomycetota bacterium]
MSSAASAVRPFPDCPLVVAYGLGVDSTAMLIEFARRGIRPDLILFADTGGEKPETNQYMDVILPFLKRVGFPDVVTVRYQPKRAAYHTLEGQCLHTGTLPSLAYGGKSCSLKYKRAPQDRYILATYPPGELIRRGGRIVRAIGFDAGEQRRTFAHLVKAIGLDASEQHRQTWQRSAPHTTQRPSRQEWLDANYFAYWYPLMEWGYDRERCKKIIAAAGLPVPIKSACFFCPASKKAEIAWLQEHHPELLERALRIERNAQPKLRSVKGLGRSFAWASFLSQLDNLPLLQSCGCN